MAISTAFNASDRARGLAIKTLFKDLRQGNVALLPQQLAIFGPAEDSITPVDNFKQIFSAQEAGDLYGFGSLLYYAARELFPVNGDGIGNIPVTVYPVANDNGTTALNDITPVITPGPGAIAKATFQLNFNGTLSKNVTIEIGDTVDDICNNIVAAINAVPDMPVIADVDAPSPASTKVVTTSKWSGVSANNYNNPVLIGNLTGTDVVIAFSFTPATGGPNLNLDNKLALIGERWETMLLNCYTTDETSLLDSYQTFGETRWGALTRKPLMVFTGSNADLATLTALGDSRKTDRINAVLVNQSSSDTEIKIAARVLTQVIRLANQVPAQDYGGVLINTLTTASDPVPWDYAQRDTAIKAGISSPQVRNNAYYISDTVTFYHPDNDPNPAYRYVVDIVKLQNIIFNLDLIFQKPEWDGAPLVPKNQPVTLPEAKRESDAVAEIAAMIDSLASLAIISDPDTAKQNTFAEIDPGNPKRLNLKTTLQLSGNTNLISVDFEWGFFFGQNTVLV